MRDMFLLLFEADFSRTSHYLLPKRKHDGDRTLQPSLWTDSTIPLQA
jgi:hypothetical protein